MSLAAASRSPNVAPVYRVMPVMAEQTAEEAAFARSPECRAFVLAVTRRDLPPAILDASVLAQVRRYIEDHGVERGAAAFKARLMESAEGAALLALCRAVFTNAKRMKARGVDLWS